MKARSRVFLLAGFLLILSIGWYFYSARVSGDLQLIGTVDANEVIVSSRIAGRIETLTVEEGQTVKAGQLIASIESEDLAAARAAAHASAEAAKFKLLESRDTQRQTTGQTSSQVQNAEAQLRMARASLLQAQAQYARQEADTTRTIALAEQGVASAQARDEGVALLNAAKAAVDGARESVAAAQASLEVALANINQAKAAAQTTAATRQEMKNAQAMLDQAKVELGYAQVQGKIIAKLVEADFATQRDVSRNKRDIKTVQLKLLIDNPGMRYVPGMTAEVYIPKSRLVKP